jgi:hypothetical protein
MPVDKMISDSMLGTFRNMVQECRDKKCSGPSFDKMVAEMNKMETFAEDFNDMGAFSAKLMTEGCFNNFSTYYSQVLSEAAQAGSQSSGGSAGDEDAGFLKQTLAAYQDAINRYDQDVKSGIMKPKDAAALRQGVQAVIDLGKSGVTYPVFLRQMIEKGLDKAMEGSAVARDGLLSDLAWATFINYPLEIKMRGDILAAFDLMAAKAPFGVPDSFLFALARQEIEWKCAPDIAKWKAIQERWDRILNLMNDWIDAHTNFAMKDERWVDIANPSATQKNIKRTKEVNPFRLREREKFLKEAFNISWDDIFTHETYRVAWTNVDISLTAEKIELLKKAHAVCKPGGAPSAEMIQEAEKLHESKADYRFAEREAVGQKMKQKFESYYGEGSFDRQYKS